MKKKKPDFLQGLLVFFFVVLVIAIVSFFVLDSLNSRSNSAKSYIYLGDGGDYLIEEVENQGIIFYHIYVSDGVKNFVYPMRYSPRNVEDVSLSGRLDRFTIRPIVYVTQDPELIEKTQSQSIVAATEFGRILAASEFGVYDSQLEYTHTSGDGLISVKTCEDTGDGVAVVHIREGEGPSVFVESDCVIVQGANAEELIQAADALSYHLLGVFSR